MGKMAVEKLPEERAAKQKASLAVIMDESLTGEGGDAESDDTEDALESQDPSDDEYLGSKDSETGDSGDASGIDETPKALRSQVKNRDQIVGTGQAKEVEVEQGKKEGGKPARQLNAYQGEEVREKPVKNNKGGGDKGKEVESGKKQGKGKGKAKGLSKEMGKSQDKESQQEEGDDVGVDKNQRKEKISDAAGKGKEKASEPEKVKKKEEKKGSASSKLKT
jgi:hypothetical protein